MCKEYLKSYRARVVECVYYGDMSELCILDGRVCKKPWLDPEFIQSIQAAKAWLASCLRQRTPEDS